MKKLSRQVHQRGVSLIELSVALIIFGVALLMLWQFSKNHNRSQTNSQSDLLLDRVQSNLIVYATLHGRLPCPAKNVQGYEVCDGTEKGYLPYLTLGLPEAAAGHLLYTVPPLPPGLTGGSVFSALMPAAYKFPSNLVVQATLLEPLVTAISTYDHVMDLCAALADKSVSNALTEKLIADDLAFSLTAKKRESLIDTGVPVSEPYSRLVSRGQLGGQMHCAAIYANAGRAHFNARLTSATMARTLYDYQTQSDISHGNDVWELVNNVWWWANNIYGISKATRIVFNATAKLMLNFSDVPAIEALAWASGAFATSTAGLAYQISGITVKSKGLIDAKATHDNLDLLLAQSLALDEEIQRNAVLNSSSYFFLAEQSSSPLKPVVALEAMPGMYHNGGELGEAAWKAAGMTQMNVQDRVKSMADEIPKLDKQYDTEIKASNEAFNEMKNKIKEEEKRNAENKEKLEAVKKAASNATDQEKREAEENVRREEARQAEQNEAEMTKRKKAAEQAIRNAAEMEKRGAP